MRKKRSMTTALLCLVFFMGLSLLLYPAVSNAWNRRHQTRAIVDYERGLGSLTPADYDALFARAEEYNRALRELKFPFTEYDVVAGYEEALNVLGNGIMGYITIPKLQTELPIYHGTSDGVLSAAVGHLEGSSLPVGGGSTHCVLSAHSGLPSAKLFTDLDTLEPGDVFSLSVLDRVLVYEVDRIQVVEPKQVEALYVQAGKDYCTLVTCTPYGVNSHRLLVRGHRVEPTERSQPIPYTGDDAPVALLGAMFIICGAGIAGIRKRGDEGYESSQADFAPAAGAGGDYSRLIGASAGGGCRGYGGRGGADDPVSSRRGIGSGRGVSVIQGS